MSQALQCRQFCALICRRAVPCSSAAYSYTPAANTGCCQTVHERRTLMCGGLHHTPDRQKACACAGAPQVQQDDKHQA